MNEHPPPFYPAKNWPTWSWRIALAAVLVTGCVPSLKVSGYPLYPDAAHRPPPEDVVRLFGLIASVDGRDVSQLGSAFELPPGRHLVRTRADPVESTNYVTMVGRPSARSFLFTMKPGYSYIVKRRVLEEMGSRFRVVVFAEEHGPTGNLDDLIYPAAAEDDAGIHIQTPGETLAAPGFAPGSSGSPSPSDAWRLEHPAASPRSF